MASSETAHIKYHSLKLLARNILSFAKLNITYPLNPGFSAFGLNVFSDPRPGPIRYRSSYALTHAIALKPKRVLDVGSGGGYHAKQFAKAGSEVTCVDYGTSIYAGRDLAGIDVIHMNFMDYRESSPFDLVWASHILEHQRNPGLFIEKLIACCHPEGRVCITVPDPHRKLWGGHVSLWTPGLLAYNIALCGVDLSAAEFVRGSNEFSIFFQPKRVELPADLTYDYGDLDKLSSYLPNGWRENADPWQLSYRDPAA